MDHLRVIRDLKYSSFISNTGDNNLIKMDDGSEFIRMLMNFYQNPFILSFSNDCLLSTSRYNSNQLFSQNNNPSDKTPSILNSSIFGSIKLQQSTLNQVVWQNNYYNEIKMVNQYNYKKYKKEIDTYFDKLEDCLSNYLVNIYKSEGSGMEYKIYWDEKRRIYDIFKNFRTSPFKYTHGSRGLYITVLNKFKEVIQSNIDENEKLFKMKFQNINEKIENFLICFESSFLINENRLKCRMMFLEIISEIKKIKHNKYSGVSELENGYILCKFEDFISDFDEKIKNDDSYDKYFPEIKAFLRIYKERRKYFNYRPSTITGKYFMINLFERLTTCLLKLFPKE